MKNLGTLYCYEMKKILRRKIVWIATALMLLTAVISNLADVFGDYVVDGTVIDSNYNQFLIDQKYERALSGRALDQTLMEEVSEGYGKIPPAAERYSLTEEYQRYARPYSSVFHIIRWMTGMTVSETMAWEMDYEEMYRKHAALLEEKWKEQQLTEAEKEYWRKREESLPRPLIYEYEEGYVHLLDMLYAIAIPFFLYIAICLSGVFAEEHSRRIDQLLLSSKYGKQPLYFAKIMAGLSFAAVSALVFTGVIIGVSLAIYGRDGFMAAVQLTEPDYSGHLSAGMAALIGCGVLVISSILTAAIVLLFSELLRSSMPTLALVAAGIIFSGFVNIPDQYRILGQLWDYLPFNFTAAWNILDVRLVSVFGILFQGWQIVPVCYLVLAGLLAAGGAVFYCRYQVKGR